MKIFLSHAFVAVALVVAGGALAVDHNPALQATMKAISRDLAELELPTKKPAADITDAVVWSAIARARTAAFALELVAARREGEMLPPKVDHLSPGELKDALGVYADYLRKAKGQLGEAEALLQVEIAKPVPADRDFAPLKATLGRLGATIGDAHKAFKPPKP